MGQWDYGDSQSGISFLREQIWNYLLIVSLTLFGDRGNHAMYKIEDQWTGVVANRCIFNTFSSFLCNSNLQHASAYGNIRGRGAVRQGLLLGFAQVYELLS